MKRSITGFITRRLKLNVNEQKSAVARPVESKFLGFSLTGAKEPKRRIAAKALVRFKRRALATATAASSHSCRRMANSPAMSLALPIAYFDALGLPRLFTGSWLNPSEPPDADRHVRWCGRGEVLRPPPVPNSN